MWYDADKIIRESNSLNVAKALGMEIRKRGKVYNIFCPGHKMRSHKEDRHMGNAYLTPHGYKCEACGVCVNTVKMAMEVAGFNYKEALEFVADVNGGREFYYDEEKNKDNYSYDKKKKYDENKKDRKSTRLNSSHTS